MGVVDSGMVTGVGRGEGDEAGYVEAGGIRCVGGGGWRWRKGLHRCVSFVPADFFRWVFAWSVEVLLAWFSSL